MSLLDIIIGILDILRKYNALRDTWGEKHYPNWIISIIILNLLLISILYFIFPNAKMCLKRQN